MPSEINPLSIFIISLCSILITIIVSIFPALKAAKLDPIKAKEILDETISLSGDQIEIWSKTNDIRKELDYDERLNILGLMWEIVLVDDILDVFEAQLMRRVSGLLYISDVDSGNSKKRALMKLKDSNL